MSNLIFSPLGSGFASASFPKVFSSEDNLSSIQKEFKKNIYQASQVFHSQSQLRFLDKKKFFPTDLISDETFDLVQKKEPSASLKNDPLVGLKVTADIQYWEDNNIFVAEGNVQTLINGAQLKADKIEVNQLNKTLIATGNVVFTNGLNFFTASYFKYNLQSKEGRLDNVYGIINIKLIPEDLNLLEYSDSSEKIIEEEVNSTIRDVELKDGFILEGSFDPAMKILSNDESQSNSINKWRLKAANIWIKKNGWEAKEVSFTNDPFNPPQSRIYSYKVELKGIDDGSSNYVLTAQRSYLILEENFRIPLGNRKISNYGSSEWKRLHKWILAIDGKDRDGVFIGRQMRQIKLSKDFLLSLQPQYLIQRSIEGETNSYPKHNDSVHGPKIKDSTSYMDNFGLEAEIKGRIFNWDAKINSDISSLNVDRLTSGSRHSIDFTKKLDLINNKGIEANIFGAYRHKIWNGSIGNDDIYTAYGVKFDNNGTWELGDLKSSYDLRVGLGKYQAQKKNSNSEYLDLWRSNVNATIDIKFPLKFFEKKEISKYKRSPYSPKVISPGLYLNSQISSSHFLYEDNNYQSTLGFGLGPELNIGNLQRHYFDYTKISILPIVTIKNGDSPFSFDNAGDLITLNLELSQHLLGPILIKTLNQWNIDSTSDNYGDSLASKTAIMLQRRAYQLGLFYDFENKAGGISFSLNGFDFKGIPDPF